MKKKYLLILIIIVIAAAIRLYNPVFRSVWGDESHSIYAAMEFSKHNIITSSFALANDSHLPAYFVLLSAWIGMFGVGEYALRLLSVIIGIAAVIAFYFFARELFDDETAGVATLLIAVSPLAVMHSHEIRMYGFLLLMTILSSLYFWRSLSGKAKSADIAGYFAFTVILLLTHIYAILIPVSQGLFVIYDIIKERDLKRAFPVLASAIAAAILASPLYINLIFKGFSGLTSGAYPMPFAVFPSFIKPFLYFFVLSLGETVAPWNYLITVPAAAIFGGLFISAFYRISDKRTAYLLTLCVAPVLMAAFFLKPTMPKYLIICLPFYLLLIGAAIFSIRNVGARYLVISVILILQLFSIHNYFSFREYHNSNQMEPWRHVASMIEKGYQPGDVVLASNYHIVSRILSYYIKISDHKPFAVLTLEKGYGNSVNIKNVKAKRIWLVAHVLDDRILPEGYLSSVRRQISGRYLLVHDEKFIPYEATMASKMPIKRHKEGSSRIGLSLYKAK